MGCLNKRRRRDGLTLDGCPSCRSSLDHRTLPAPPLPLRDDSMPLALALPTIGPQGQDADGDGVGVEIETAEFATAMLRLALLAVAVPVAE